MLCLLSLAFAKHPMVTPEAMQAQRLLQMGANLKARALLQEQVAAHPKSGGLALMLMETYTAEGDCEGALEVATPWRDKKVWTVEHSWALARCFGGAREYGEALYWADEAMLLTPEPSVDDWLGVAELRWGLGDYAAAAEAMQEASALAPASEEITLFRVRVAVEEGLVDAADALIAQLDLARTDARLRAMVLRAAMEVDLGELDTALATLAQVGRRPMPQANLVYSEIYRRRGDPVAALGSASRRTLRSSNLRVPMAQARALVDLGRLEEAAERLQPWLSRSPLDPDVLATAWYLARARGEQAEAERLAALYGRVQPNPLRTLASLMPPESP